MPATYSPAMGRGGYNKVSPPTSNHGRRTPSPNAPVLSGRGGYNSSPRNLSPRDDERKARSRSIPPNQPKERLASATPSPMGRGGYNASPRSKSPAMVQPVPMGRGGYNATARSSSPATNGQPVPMGRGGYNGTPKNGSPTPAPNGRIASPRIGTPNILDSPILSGRGGYNASSRSGSPAPIGQPVLTGRGGYNSGSPNLSAERLAAAFDEVYLRSRSPSPSIRSPPTAPLYSPDPTIRRGHIATPPNRSPNRSPALNQAQFPEGRGGYNSTPPR